MNEIKISKGLKREDGLNVQSLLVKAKKMIQNGKHENALRYLLELIEDEGVKHADFFYLIGEIYRQKKDYEKSVKFLLESIKFKVYPDLAVRSLGLSYFAIGKYGKANMALNGYLDKIVRGFFEILG